MNVCDRNRFSIAVKIQFASDLYVLKGEGLGTSKMKLRISLSPKMDFLNLLLNSYSEIGRRYHLSAQAIVENLQS